VDTLLVASAGGLHEVADRGGRLHLEGRDVTAVSGLGWALLEGREVVHCEHGEWTSYGAVPDGVAATCIEVGPHGLLLGTRGGGLLRLDDDGFTPVGSFDDAPGRSDWYTPWGGPPDVRSLAVADDGTILVNVHVGGILRSDDGGSTWEATVDLHVDVHQAAVVPGTSTVVAATGTGFASSTDGGRTWAMEDDGLHATYLRAVAVAGDAVVVSASRGPGGGAAALYRRPLAGGPFERGGDGLPEDLGGNVDTGRVVAHGDRVAAVLEDGSVHRSDDGARRFACVAEGLPAPRWLARSVG
jgi:hypothetical protein